MLIEKGGKIPAEQSEPVTVRVKQHKKMFSKLVQKGSEKGGHSCGFLLHQDNAQANTALLVKQVLAQKCITVIPICLMQLFQNEMTELLR